MASQAHVPQFATSDVSPAESVTAKVTTGHALHETELHRYYAKLFAAYGPQHWWPGRTRFEIIVGAILTQNTAWVNVEHAISNLRRARVLSRSAMERMTGAQLGALIRPAGYFRQKAKTLKAFLHFLRVAYGGSLSTMFRAPTHLLRDQLLGVRGIGPETADSILLYAGSHPVFVVDAYARRILERHGLTDANQSYQGLRDYFERHLPRDISLYNEFHALIVRTGKDYCRKREPLCRECPLRPLLPDGMRHP